MFAALGREANIDYVDMPQSLRPRYQYFTQARVDKLRKAGCTLEFRSLEESIKDYVQYLSGHNYL